MRWPHIKAIEPIDKAADASTDKSMATNKYVFLRPKVKGLVGC